MKPSFTLLFSFLFTLLTISPLRSEVDCYHDYVAPVAICDAHTVVALSNTGTAKLFATDIDDGSYDNCHLESYQARRMTQGWCPPGVADDTQFRPYVEFCCEDVGQTIWVVLRVTDAHGNYNECMAEVTVQDNTYPELWCPPNITVSCNFWFSPDALNNPYNRTFGTIAVNGAPRLPIIINDPGNSYYNQPHNWGLDGAAGSGVCGGGNVWVTIPEVIDYRNSCGVGIIKRKFYLEAGNWSDWCYQTITVKDYTNSYYDINWPLDYVGDACLYGPEDVDPEDLYPPYNKPTINGGSGYGNSCSLVGYAHEDLVFTFSDGACKKILREWTVIDWCTYQPNNPWSPGIWHHTQVIKLMNSNPPTFVYGCQDVVVDGYEPNCSGRFYHQPLVEDDCTPAEHLKWDYKIDLWNDGTYDINYEGTGQPTVDKVLPNGWHKILWNVSDACGNYRTCSYKVHVVDKKAPSPICYYGLSTVVMPLGGMVTIWAKDFNASSYDNCTPAYKLKYSFSANPWETSRTFTCDDLGTVPIQIWVHDEYGNKDYCTTFIKLNDNEDACEGMNVVQGLVSTFTEVPVPQVSAAMFKIMPDLSLDEDESQSSSDVTGHFTLGFGTTQYNRMVMLSREGKKLEGISTLDLIALQRHLNGDEPITEPYKLYAADLDGNGRVGANDLLLLKKAILGGFKLQSYTGNLSWIFFGDPCTPDAPLDLFTGECHNGVEIDRSGVFPAVASFKALKMGDVNADMVNMAWLLTPRTSKTLQLAVRENQANHSYDIIATRDADIYGFQMSVNHTEIGLTAGRLALDESNLAIDKDGFANISWGKNTATSVKAGEVLFTLENLPAELGIEGFLVNQDESLYPEIYTEGLDNELIELVPFEEVVSTTSFESRISPNPFTDVTKLKVIIPAGEEFHVTLYDTRGQELFNRNYVSYTNEAEIVIDSDIISLPGVYYYRVKSNLGELSGKFVRQ
jgi:hypothetical protein